MHETLTHKTLYGIKWSYISTITNSVMQIGYTAIMARLLEPKAFGLVAMAGVIIRFGSYFAQMGMGQALIQKKDLNKEEIRAAFTASIILSTLFLILIWILAPLATIIFNEPKVIPIIRVLALSFVITGFSTTALSLMRKNMKFKPLAVINIISYVISYLGVGVIFGLLGFGVWSLVFATLSRALVLGILSYLYIRHPVSLLFNWKHYKPLFSFGGKISIISFLEFIGGSLDTLAIGHFSTAGELGIYNRSFMVVNLPMQYLTTSISGVLFPSFSIIQSENEKLKRIYLNSIATLAFFLFPICFGISVAAKPIILIILGQKWHAAIPVLSILALATPFNLLSHIGGVTCDSTGNLTPKIFMQIIYILILGTLFYLFKFMGLEGYALSVVIAEVFKNLSYILITKKILSYDVREIVNTYWPALLNGIIIAGIIFSAITLTQNISESQLIRFIVAILTGGIGLIILFFTGFNKISRNLLEEKILNNINLYQHIRDFDNMNK